jgi:ribonuclease T1
VQRAAPASVADACRKLGLALFGAAVLATAAPARTAPGEPPTVALSELPPQARQVEALIRRGGPFPYLKDGGVFFNREGQLPRNARGYYREYTVATPGARDRGARRIVCGGREPAVPDACFYTADHYASFRRIVQ